MRGIFIAVGFSLIAGSAAAQSAVDTQTMAASKLFPFLDTYLALPASERDHFHMAYGVMGDGPPANVHLSLRRSSGDTPIAVSPEGLILTQPSAADLKSAQVVMTTPKGSHYNISLRLLASEPLAQTLDVAPLKIGIDQARTAAKTAAGLMSMMVPDLETVCFVGAGSGQAVLTDGKAMPLKISAPPAAPKFPNPCLTPADEPEVRQVTLARLPSAILIVRRPKN